ncbi:MAG: glycosyltransferase family 4 protein, partial [Desulfobacterales bacterium]|nr:glycosyltransferase family 4 protein [Desulfobacterales bacterium]
MPKVKQPTLLHVTTVPMSLRFIQGQIDFMQSKGLHVECLCSPGEFTNQFIEETGVPVHTVVMSRRITPFRDIVALFRIWQIMRRIRPTIVHAHTPKGGLLGILGAWLAKCPVKIYGMRGLPCMTETGMKRGLLEITEKISCLFSNLVIAESMSLRKYAIDNGLTASRKVIVLGKGSGQGVDAENRFDPKKYDRSAIRNDLKISKSTLVIGFVGRLVRDKGVNELIEAWKEIRERFADSLLLIVGEFEPQDPVSSNSRNKLLNDDRVKFLGFREDVELLYAAMDLVVLPTYREGLPNVLMEAASMMLPIVSTNIVGCIDVIENGVTGILVPPRDVKSLIHACCLYLDNKALRKKHGQAARQHILTNFLRGRISDELIAVYN